MNSTSPTPGEGPIPEPQPPLSSSDFATAGLVVEPATPPAWLQPPGPGFWGAIGLILASFVIQGIGLGIYIASSHLELSDPVELTRKLAVPSMILTFVAGTILVLAAFGADCGRRLAIRRIGPAQLAAVLLLVPPLLLTDLSFANWISRPTSAEQVSPPLEDEDKSTSENFRRRPVPGTLFDVANSTYDQLADNSWPVILFYFCLLPAIGEEPFFRGLLGRGLVARYGATGIAIASFLFAVQHITPDHILATFLLGMTAQLIYLATKSFWAPLVLHVGNNLLATVPDKFQQEFGHDPTGLEPFGSHIPPSLTLAGVVTTVLLVALLFQMKTRWKLPGGERWNPGYLTAEIPPADLCAVPVQDKAAPGMIFLTVVAYLAFAVTYAWHAFGPGALART